MDGEYDSVKVAKLLLALAYEKGYALNITKVQKMLYIIYGHFMAKGVVLLNEAPKAWPYGPVFPRTRSKVDFGIVYKKDDDELKEVYSNKGLVAMIDGVIELYSKYTATQLSDWSHKDGSPWDKTTKEKDFKWGNIISNEYIKEYFSK